MVLPSGAYTNASLYNQNAGTPAWTGEINPEFYATSLASQIHMNVQHRGSMLAGVFREEPKTGEINYFRRIDPTSARTSTTRYKQLYPKQHYDALAAASVDMSNADYYDELTGDKRLVVPTHHYIYPLLSTDWDEYYMDINPDSEKVLNSAYAIGRQEDRELITNGVYGTAVEGHGISGAAQTSIPWDPSTTDSESNEQYLIGADGVGLINGKIKKVTQRFMDLGVSMEDIVGVITPRQVTDFIEDTNKFLSRDYISSSPVMSYVIPPGYLGIGRWIVIGRYPGNNEAAVVPLAAGTNERRCFFASRRGIAKGRWRNMAPVVESVPTMDDAKVAKIKTITGSVRMEEKLLIEVRCDES